MKEVFHDDDVDMGIRGTTIYHAGVMANFVMGGLQRNSHVEHERKRSFYLQKAISQKRANIKF
jgi:hypothetical protein